MTGDMASVSCRIWAFDTMVLLLIAVNSVSSRTLYAFDETFVDEETRVCQERCLSDPALFECDQECATRYPDPHLQGVCVRFCTRNIYMCLSRCAHPGANEEYKKLQDILNGNTSS